MKTNRKQKWWLHNGVCQIVKLDNNRVEHELSEQGLQDNTGHLILLIWSLQNKSLPQRSNFFGRALEIRNEAEQTSGYVIDLYYSERKFGFEA